MSYILDALKRAESERSRGEIPNIHAQQAATGASDVGRAASRQIGPGLIGVALLVLVAGSVWWWRADDAPAPPDRVTAAPASVPVPGLPVTSAAAPGQPPAPTSPRTAQPTLPLRLPTAMPVQAPVVIPKPAIPKVMPKTAPVLAAIERIDKPARAASTPATANAPASAPPSPSEPALAEERLYALKELPDDIRNSLPVLTVGGATYSENPANRMLIVNGRLFHEGDKLTPELTLQQIKLRSAVLSYRGYRYGINY